MPESIKIIAAQKTRQGRQEREEKSQGHIVTVVCSWRLLTGSACAVWCKLRPPTPLHDEYQIYVPSSCTLLMGEVLSLNRYRYVNVYVRQFWLLLLPTGRPLLLLLHRKLLRRLLPQRLLLLRLLPPRLLLLLQSLLPPRLLLLLLRLLSLRLRLLLLLLLLLHRNILRRLLPQRPLLLRLLPPRLLLLLLLRLLPLRLLLLLLLLILFDHGDYSLFTQLLCTATVTLAAAVAADTALD